MNWADDRAQALQVGAVLLLGILVIGLSIYQVTVVPQENREVEFNSYLDASTDMSDLRNDILASAQRGVQSGTTVETGTTYPVRALFVNPPPSGGRLDALDARDVTIEGAEAVGSEPTNVEAVWNGSARDYPTQKIRFSPAYNRLDASPVVADGGSVYRVTDNGPIPLAGQSLVDGNRITLVTVGGDLSTGGLASTVTTEPVSTTQRTVTVTGEGPEFTITLRFASTADAAAWNASRVAEDYREQPRVLRTNHPGNDTVDVVLDGDETYELRIGRVTVHEASENAVESEPDPEYVIPVAGNDSDVVNRSTVTLTAEVRDRYNNPVTGTDVTFSSSDGTVVGNATVPTTEDGRASVRFDVNATGTATVTASFARATSFNEATFELDVTAVGAGAGGGADDVNPSGDGDVILDAQSPVGSGNNGDDSVYIDLENNTEASSLVNITQVRMNYYFDGNPGTGSGDPALGSDVDIYAPSQGVDIGDSTTFTIGGNYRTLTTPIPLNPYQSDTSNTTRIRIDFTEAIEAQDFYILSIRAEIDGETRTFTYFISHPR